LFYHSKPGDKAFSAAKAWNRLPTEIHSCSPQQYSVEISKRFY